MVFPSRMRPSSVWNEVGEGDEEDADRRPSRYRSRAPQPPGYEEQPEEETDHKREHHDDEACVGRTARDQVRHPRAVDDPDQGEGDSYVSENYPPAADEPKKPYKSRHEEHRGEHYKEVRGLHATGTLDHRFHETGVPPS